MVGTSRSGQPGALTVTRPLLLDLFCGAGGAAMGYYRAGFDVVGVDIEPQPHYPFEFIQGNALDFMMRLEQDWAEFDAIHASPPCQGYANLGNDSHPKHIGLVRDLLLNAGQPYVIENIEDARRELRNPVRLCGSTFDLNVRRHRWFECSFPVMVPPCQHDGREIRAYYGKPGWAAWTPAAAAVQSKDRKPLLRGKLEQAPEDMGIDWMQTWDEVREAIPPAYTEFIGAQLLEHLARVA
jgi:DNA (cytosine-5)-methyltransferase 1